MISFIVSTYHRPLHLTCCISSLSTQETEKDYEIIVCDNSTNREFVAENKKIAAAFDCWYLDTSRLGDPVGGCCYHNLSYIKPKGKWLCFPSDDSYYVPLFTKIMLNAAEANDWEFVYCDMLYDPRLAYTTRNLVDTYSVMDVQPSPGRIDKTGFIVSRRAFEAVGGWPQHEGDWRDGALADALVHAGIRHGKAPGIMVVHN